MGEHRWRRRDVLRGAAGVALGAAGLASAGVLGACERNERGVVVLELWTLALKPYFNEFMARTIGAFEQSSPGVRVNWVDVPYEALQRKLIAAAAAGRAPDVVNLSDLQFGRFVGLGAVCDLDEHVPGNPGEVYLDGALRLGRIGGRLMALPWYLTTQVSMMNTALLERGGLAIDDVADTWTELAKQARAFHERTGVYLFSQPMGAESQVPVMMLGEGIVPIVVQDGRLTGALSAPAAREYVQRWVDLYRAGGLPREAATQGHSHLTEMYKEGRLAMIDTGPNFLSRVRQDSPGVFKVTHVRAGVTGRLNRQHIATMVLGVTSTSRHKDLAARLAWYLTSAKAQSELCALTPVLPSAVESVRTLGDLPKGKDAAVDEARTIAGAALTDATVFTPALVAWPDMRRAFEDGLRRMMLDGADVQNTLGEVDAQWDRLLLASGERSLDAVPAPGRARASGSGARGHGA